MFIKYIPMALAAWLMTLLSFIISPFLAAYSVVANVNNLNYPWSYFTTHDNTLDGGFDDGVDGYKDPATLSKFKLFWQRTKWICRNPAYRFVAEVLGFLHEGYKVVSESNPGANFSENTSNYTVMEDAEGKRYFSYRANIGIGGKRYIKLWLGWNTAAYGGIYHQLKSLPGSLRKRG